ncbi:MAG: glycosyltransferase family 2 protein [Candidatus Nanopelagicaceae bacterium]
MEKVTVALIIEGFGADALASIDSILNSSDANLMVLINGKQENINVPSNPRIEVIEVKQKLGWGNAINHLLSEITTKFVVIMDPSTTFKGDAITAAVKKTNEGFVAVGWRGGLVNVEDEWRTVEDKGDGEVDVLFSYFMLVDREFAARVGANPSAKYYRNADLEFSLAIREAGGKLYQLDLPLEQGRHHGYHDVDPAYREKHSKENYNRILRRFRGKSDILSPRR